MPKSLQQGWHSQVPKTPANDVVNSPVSDLERDTLEKFRATPVLEAVLKPKGEVAVEVVRDVEAQREARIGYITKRLDAQKSRARDGFTRSR